MAITLFPNKVHQNLNDVNEYNPSSPQLTYDMTTNYNKTDRLSPTTRKPTGHNSRKTQSLLLLRPPYASTYCQHNFYKHHTEGRQAQLTKEKMHSKCRLSPDHIVCKITQRNNIRRANFCDPALKLLNEEITYSLEDRTRSIQQSTSIHTKHFHNIQ